jgi:hypothetical protein
MMTNDEFMSELRELQILKKEFAEMFGISSTTARNWGSRPQVPKWVDGAIKILKENRQLREMSLFDELKQWREERGLHQIEGNEINVLKHMILECTEGMEANVNGDADGVVDAICDAIIYGFNGLEQLGYDAELSMSETLKEIHSRKGYYNVDEGKFDKVITGNEYKADYSKAKR